ncbi:hypothetical protein CDCA_CDCA05G1548 [Cyanidium caldarium]|uniref:Inhibitor of growth protein n=1 Tax=Cyanidium caldarium TaxID=2771 RepID=A0AAV9ITX1_CYACA|nr:hypothetical protein CDCA_CDCA05G1548 [Cyanidium caldarium]
MAYRGLASIAQPAYLEDYVNSLAALPNELREKYHRIGEMDAEVVRLQREAEVLLRDAARRSQAGGSSSDKKRDLAALRRVWPRVEQLQVQCMRKGGEKVALAESAYTVVDRYVRELDAKLREYEAYLRREGQWPEGVRGMGTPAGESAGSSPGRALPPRPDEGMRRVGVTPERVDAGGAAGASAPPSSSASVVGGFGAVGVAGAPLPPRNFIEDMPVDPNEPRYCYCGDVSYGEMVACESGNCPYEWFHFQCVGLTEAPNGTWLCPDCRARAGRVR